MSNKLFIPNLYNVFEIKYCSANRIRMEINKLKNNDEEIYKLRNNLEKIDVIKKFKIVRSLGNLTIEFDNSKIDSQFMIGIVLNLLNLNEEFFKKRKVKTKNIFDNLVTVTDISIYNKSKGFLDTKTLIALALLVYSLKKIKTTPLFPTSATLVWWAFNLLSRDNILRKD